MAAWLVQMLSMAFALFLLINPIGNIPVFVSVLKDVDSKRHKWIIFRELLIALSIMILFQFAGNGLLNFLRVSTSTTLISGGLILFIIALHMIFPPPPNPAADSATKKDPFIVPLATPLIAGPAVLAAIMLYSGQPRLNPVVTVGAIIIAWAVSTGILLSSSVCKRVLGSRGLIACERLMGLILTLIAVQMFLEGIQLVSAK